jgi:hypothetical protein
MFGQISAAYRGRRQWAKLERKYERDQGVYVLVMPEDDAELNAAALDHVEELVADRRARGVVLVRDSSSPQAMPSYSGHSPTLPDHPPDVIGTEFWTSREIDALIAFYELYAFSDRLLIVSLTKPFGNGLNRLLGRQGVTKEDLVCLGCLRLRHYREGKA